MNSISFIKFNTRPFYSWEENPAEVPILVDPLKSENFLAIEKRRKESFSRSVKYFVTSMDYFFWGLLYICEPMNGLTDSETLDIVRRIIIKFFS